MIVCVININTWLFLKSVMCNISNNELMSIMKQLLDNSKHVHDNKKILQIII